MTEFEGTEKKIEIVLSAEHPCLRSYGLPFWSQVVEKSQAKILSYISNDLCDAYLLSESSLFVFSHRVIMLTCGTTRLVDAINFILDQINIDQIEMFFYERKNELFPDDQPTSFEEDVKSISKRVPGKVLTFGDSRGHHIDLFTLDRDCVPSDRDMTLQVLMYDIDNNVAQDFYHCVESKKSTDEACIPCIFDDFQVDDFLFKPMGYSLNAIKDKFYYTIHVTPQKSASYVSFETNMPYEESFNSTVKKVTEIFKPKSFDLLFYCKDCLDIKMGDVTHYTSKDESSEKLDSGFKSWFCHFERI